MRPYWHYKDLKLNDLILSKNLGLVLNSHQYFQGMGSVDSNSCPVFHTNSARQCFGTLRFECFDLLKLHTFRRFIVYELPIIQ